MIVPQSCLTTFGQAEPGSLVRYRGDTRSIVALLVAEPGEARAAEDFRYLINLESDGSSKAFTWTYRGDRDTPAISYGRAYDIHPGQASASYKFDGNHSAGDLLLVGETAVISARPARPSEGTWTAYFDCKAGRLMRARDVGTPVAVTNWEIRFASSDPLSRPGPIVLVFPSDITS